MSELFDDAYDSYQDQVEAAIGFAGQKHQFYTSVKAEFIRDKVRKHFSRPEAVKILDYGCGIGLTDTMLAAHFPQITGVDVSEKSVAAAKERNPGLNYVHLTGSRLPFPDASFDVVFAICVIHHVQTGSWAQFVAEMKRVTKKGGLIFIGEHNPLNPLTRLVVARTPFDRGATLAGPDRLRRLLGPETKQRVDYILFFPFSSKILRRMEEALKWLPMGAQYFVTAEKSD